MSIAFRLSEEGGLFWVDVAAAAELLNVEDLSLVSGCLAAAGSGALFRDELRALASKTSETSLKFIYIIFILFSL